MQLLTSTWEALFPACPIAYIACQIDYHFYIVLNVYGGNKLCRTRFSVCFRKFTGFEWS